MKYPGRLKKRNIFKIIFIFKQTYPGSVYMSMGKFFLFFQCDVSGKKT